MNLAQRIALGLGLIVVALIVLFPPWIYVYHYEPEFRGRGGLTDQHSERPAGYHAIWTPHVATDQTELIRLFSINRDEDEADLRYFSMRIDKDRLWIQLAGVIVLTALLTILLKSKVALASRNS